MTSLNPNINAGILVDVPFPAIDLLAVMPYVIPLVFGAIIFALYQRHLMRESRERNFILALSIAGFVVSFMLVLYAGFGSVWWWSEEFTLGSWRYLIGYLQFGTDLIFGSVITGVIYLVAASIVFAIISTRVIAPPDPDFAAMRDEIQTKEKLNESLIEKVQKLEAENKELNEFLGEREENLVAMEEELDSLKDSMKERETELAKAQTELEEAAESVKEIELEKKLSEKNSRIKSLEEEISGLRSALEEQSTESEGPTEESAAQMDKASELKSEVDRLQKKVEDMKRRTETASEVSDSLISDLAALISNIESSSLEESTKKSLVTLVENLGRAMGRVSTSAADSKDEQPQVELIGAVLMMHEIIDGIKKIAR